MIENLSGLGAFLVRRLKFSHSEGEEGRTVSLRMSWQNGVSVVKPDTPFNHFTFSYPPTYSFPSGNHHSALYVYTFSLIWLVHLFFITCIWMKLQGFCLSHWLISLRMILSRSIHDSQIARFLFFFFFWWMSRIPLYKIITSLSIYSLIST